MLREGCFPFGDDVATPLARRSVSRSDAIMGRSLASPAAAVEPDRYVFKLETSMSKTQMTQLPSINFQRTYLLGEAYESIKERAIHELEKYLGYPDLITFNGLDRSVTFSTERLIPTASTEVS